LRDRRFLREARLLQRPTQAGQLAAGRGHGLVGRQRLELHVRVAQLDEQRGGRHCDARANGKLLDTTGGNRRNDPDVLRHQCAWRANFAKKLALPD